MAPTMRGVPGVNSVRTGGSTKTLVQDGRHIHASGANREKDLAHDRSPLQGSPATLRERTRWTNKTLDLHDAKPLSKRLFPSSTDRISSPGGPIMWGQERTGPKYGGWTVGTKFEYKPNSVWTLTRPEVAIDTVPCNPNRCNANFRAR